MLKPVTGSYACVMLLLICLEEGKKIRLEEIYSKTCTYFHIYAAGNYSGAVYTAPADAGLAV